MYSNEHEAERWCSNIAENALDFFLNEKEVK